MKSIRGLLGLWFCLVLTASAQSTEDVTSCSATRSYFDSRAMLASVDIQENPNSDGGGLCPTRGCCGSGARAPLSRSGKQQLEAALKSDLNKLSTVLAARARRFDEFFKGLLQQSKQEFHEMFKRTYGMIYERHSYVFTELFGELERYYTTGGVQLSQLMDKFFALLYQKMFTVLNSQYNFDDKYLQCVGEHMRETQPFDDVPHKLSIQLRRAFVATRTFQKALQAGAEVANNMNEIGVSAECGAAWARMRWCGACAGESGVSACSRYCINVARGCLPLHADLAATWDAYVEAVDKVADRLLGPFNIAMVVEPIDIKISEAIMNFQEHAVDISQKIFTSCGKPVLGSAPPNVPSAPFFAPGKRSKRTLDSLELFDDSNGDSDDFEIEESYESLVNKHPSLKRLRSEEYDTKLNDLAQKAEERQRFIDYMRGDIDSEELEGYNRPRRDADPKPAGKGSKEIDFEPYNFEGARGKKKSKKPTGVGKSKEWESGEAGGGGGGGEAMERLVREARGRVRTSRKYWSHLPYVVCNDEAVAARPSPDVSCYNGTHRAPYLPGLAGEGVTALASNPEAVPAPNKAHVLSAAQDTLKDITSKLKNAYNGLDVDWRDYAEDSSTSLFYGSGSGSGEEDGTVPDDDEDYAGSGHGPITEGETEPPLVTSAPPPAPPYVPSVVGAPPDTHNVHMKDPALMSGDDGKHIKPHYEKPQEKPYRESSGSTAASEMSLERALITYLFPVVCAWLGGIVNDIV